MIFFLPLIKFQTAGIADNGKCHQSRGRRIATSRNPAVQISRQNIFRTAEILARNLNRRIGPGLELVSVTWPPDCD